MSDTILDNFRKPSIPEGDRLKTYLITGGVVVGGLFIYFRYFAGPKDLESQSKKEIVDDGVVLEHDVYIVDGSEKAVEFHWIPYATAVSTDRFPIKRLASIGVPSYIYNFDNAGLSHTLRYFKEIAVKNKYKAFEIDDSGKTMIPIEAEKDIRYTGTYLNYSSIFGSRENAKNRSPIAGLYTAFRGAVAK